MFMSNKEIAEYERSHSTTISSVLRHTVSDKKVLSTTISTTKMPESWKAITSTDGPDDDTIREGLNVIDASYDWLACLAAAVNGTLIVLIDCDLNLEGRQVCMRYMYVTQEMLVMRFNPFSRHMNDYIREHANDLVFVPASVLVSMDRKIGEKLLHSMNPKTASEVRSKASVIVARQMNITHSGQPYLSTVDIMLALFRLGYKPTLDIPRKNDLVRTFIDPPQAYHTIEELETLFRTTENEFADLNSDGRRYHSRYSDELATWIGWIRDRSWAGKWIEENDLNDKWPTDLETLFDVTKKKAKYESVTEEKARYDALYPSGSQIHAIGTRDARIAQGQPQTKARKPKAYTSTPYDRRHTVTSAPAKQALQNRTKTQNDRYARKNQIRQLNKNDTVTLGRIPDAPETTCPCCHQSPCRGRCWCCLKPGTCADAPTGHLARDCPFRDIGFDDAAKWDAEWKLKHAHKPCKKCGNRGHPEHACPEKLRRRMLMRLAKDPESKQWINHIVAICTMKDGVDIDPFAPISAEDYDIEYTGDSQYTGCGESCGPNGCGKPHTVEVAHIYKPEQKLPVPAMSAEDYINHVVLSALGSEQSEVENEIDQDDGIDFSLYPIFSSEEQEDDLAKTMVALATEDDGDIKTMWDTGAQGHLRRSAARAQGYIREARKRLQGAQGAHIASEGEATFEDLLATDKGPPHTMQSEASICPDAPDIASAGEYFARGYGAAHNMDGVFIPKSSTAYDRVKRALGRNDKYIDLKKDEHHVITPGMELIKLHQLKKHLFYLVNIKPTRVEETEHLKEARHNDTRYGTQEVGMISAQSNISHDCELPTYITEMQKIVGDYEALSRQVAHYGASDERFSELMIATMSHLHDVQEQLESPELGTSYTQSIGACAQRLDTSALKTVCSRCHSANCITTTDMNATCQERCVTCHASIGHVHNASCASICAATRQVTVMTEHAKETWKTGRPDDDDDGEEMMREHNALHANCDERPCTACREQASQPQDQSENVATQTSPPTAYPTAQPVRTVGTDDIVTAFQSLTTRSNTPTAVTSTATNTSPTLNTAGVCKVCKKHFTGCKCQTEAQKRLTDTKKGKTKARHEPITKQKALCDNVASTSSCDFVALAHTNKPEPVGTSASSDFGTLAHPAATDHVGAVNSCDFVALSHNAVTDHVGAAHSCDFVALAYREPPSDSVAGTSCDYVAHHPSDSDTIASVQEPRQLNRKRKDETTPQEMLALVHAHAWMHVTDEAIVMQPVLDVPATTWLTILPNDDQAALAVHTQNVLHADALWKKASTEHGPSSDQATRAARRMHDAQEKKRAHIAHCIEVAQVILSAGTE